MSSCDFKTIYFQFYHFRTVTQLYIKLKVLNAYQTTPSSAPTGLEMCIRWVQATKGNKNKNELLCLTKYLIIALAFQNVLKILRQNDSLRPELDTIKTRHGILRQMHVTWKRKIKVLCSFWRKMFVSLLEICFHK